MTTSLQRVVIEVFGGCNYSCKMCPQSTGREASFLRKIPLSLFEETLDQIVEKFGNPVINLEGSGEPTMAKDLALYVEACTKRNLRSYMYCNGSRLYGSYMQDVIDAGLSFVRFSCIGYNAELYRTWMGRDNFQLIIDNTIATREYIEKTNSDCQVASYHLILDGQNIEYEVEQYRKNFIDVTGSMGYVWKMHNWSGNYAPDYRRDKGTRKSCGRPFAPELTIRAGGLDGKLGAVTPCCQTMGPPNESKSVLGHVSHQSIEEIWKGEPYENLRKAHREKNFDSIDYCRNCDFLYQNEEVLVWSNDPNASVNKMLGTSMDLQDWVEKPKVIPIIKKG